MIVTAVPFSKITPLVTFYGKNVKSTHLGLKDLGFLDWKVFYYAMVLGVLE